jgi:FKBP-type peptidyl-prolyl cis-trans isomerase SlyD
MYIRPSSRAAWLAAFLLVMTAPAFIDAAEVADDNKVVKDGKLVSLQYSLTGEDGKLIETNKGKEPLKYIQGQKQMIPGFEKELAGMTKGGEKKFKVKPEDAYGLVDQRAFQEFPKDKLPAEGLKVGAILTGQGPQGQPIRARVHQIKEKTVVLDFNHPMAGKTLIFEVKVLDIQTAAAQNPAQAAAPSTPPKPAQPTKPADPAQNK